MLQVLDILVLKVLKILKVLKVVCLGYSDLRHSVMGVAHPQQRGAKHSPFPLGVPT